MINHNVEPQLQLPSTKRPSLLGPTAQYERGSKRTDDFNQSLPFAPSLFIHITFPNFSHSRSRERLRIYTALRWEMSLHIRFLEDRRLGQEVWFYRIVWNRKVEYSAAGMTSLISWRCYHSVVGCFKMTSGPPFHHQPAVYLSSILGISIRYIVFGLRPRDGPTG